jgi:hypothetical protein
VIHRLESQIEGLAEGKPLAPMWEKATKDGLTLEAFHRLITAEILSAGRYAVLTDVPSDDTGMPYLTGYQAEQLINWPAAPNKNLFVLDETQKGQSESDEFGWVDITRYRVLRLTNGVYTQQVYEQGPGDLVTPQMRGGKKLKEPPLWLPARAIYRSTRSTPRRCLVSPNRRWRSIDWTRTIVISCTTQGRKRCSLFPATLASCPRSLVLAWSLDCPRTERRCMSGLPVSASMHIAQRSWMSDSPLLLPGSGCSMTKRKRRVAKHCDCEHRRRRRR